MTGRDLVLTEVALLTRILRRRAPDLVSLVEHTEMTLLAEADRERIRRAVVDELCELPEDASDRRALELEELLIHLGTA